MLIIPGVRMLEQENSFKFKASLGFTVRSSLQRQKQEKKKKERKGGKKPERKDKKKKKIIPSPLWQN